MGGVAPVVSEDSSNIGKVPDKAQRSPGAKVTSLASAGQLDGESEMSHGENNISVGSEAAPPALSQSEVLLVAHSSPDSGAVKEEYGPSGSQLEFGTYEPEEQKAESTAIEGVDTVCISLFYIHLSLINDALKSYFRKTPKKKWKKNK